MDRLSSSSSSPQALFRESFNENIEDPVSTDLMTEAVTIVPCGHTFNEDTVAQCLARDRLCPLDRREIERYVPNFTVRQLAESFGSLPAEEEGPSPEAETHFLQGKKHSDAGNNEQAVEAFLEALKLCPRYEKAQAYLEFCLKIPTGSSSLSNIPSPLPSLQPKKKEEAIESMSSAKEGYIKLLLEYIDNTEVQKSSQLVQFFGNQVESLMSEESVELTEQEKQNYKWAKQLIVGNKVSSFVQNKLLQLSSPSASPSLSSSSLTLSSASIASSSSSSSQSSSPQQGFSPSISCASLSPALRAMSLSAPLASQPQLPEIAFGKAKWARYFGDIGIEPPLPPNINEILNSSCIFEPSKKVYQTHLLVLIPSTVDGRPFHLDALAELIQNPKEGCKTQYKYYSNYVKGELGAESQPSHWVLMTRDVIPGSRSKKYDEQRILVQSRARESGIPYELPTALEAATAILVEYVQTGTRLYGDSPCTYTRCQEKVEGNKWPVVMGGFAAGGLYVIYYTWIVLDTCGVGGLRKFR